MEESARKASAWAEKAENTKIGFNPLKEHDRFLDTRAYIGEKARRMQQRRKNLERRQQTAIREKEQLLKNLEQPAQLRLTPLTHHKETYIRIKDASVSYGSHQVIRNFSMELKRGERILLQGKNGCGNFLYQPGYFLFKGQSGCVYRAGIPGRQPFQGNSAEAGF